MQRGTVGLLLMMVGAMGTFLSGCFAVNRAGMAVLFHEEPLPASRVVADVAYRDDPEAHPEKHRLDLYLPVGEGWPVVVFVHGGGWDSGDKNLRFGGADIYANIGRYLARRGVGAAVINYRLLPDVAWTDQFDDVAAATAWVYRHIASYGGDPGRLFLMGHSAGAHLLSRVAFDAVWLGAYGLSPDPVCGAVSVSGAAYDLTDAAALTGGGLSYLEARFGDTDGWRREVSTISFVTPAASPFLLLYAGGEPPSLQRQSHLLHEALRRVGVASRVVVVPGESHARILLTLSRDDKIAGPALLDFIRHTRCSQ